MRVAILDIQNFRGIREGSVRFKDHPVLIGSNNTGKTTVIEALTLLLGRERMIRELTEHDFYGSDPQPADRIKLVATITDFPSEDPYQNTDWFRDGRGVPKWLDEANGTISAVRTEEASKLCCQIGAQAYFDRDSLSVEMVRYFHDHDSPMDPFADDSPVGVPPRLIKEIGFYLVRASRTWDKVFSWGSELFRRTLQAAAAQPSEAILAERDRLRRPEAPIENDDRISPLIQNVNAELARCIPNAPHVQLRVTSTDSRSLLDSVAAHFAVVGGLGVPAARQGSGLVSLQGLLLLLELGRGRAAAGEGFLMALEEPELHLPPAGQQQLVQRVQALSTQTFITTHSPLIAAVSDPTSVLILRNVDGHLSALPFLSEPLLPNAQNWKRKFFQQSRVDVLSALMHPCVLVPEGRADFLLLKTVLRPLMLTEGWSTSMPSMFGLEVGVVPTEDAQVVETFQLLSATHHKVCCLVDGDRDGKRYITSLLGEPTAPSSIIRWADDEMIEDAVGWILAADEGDVVGRLSELTEVAPSTVSDIVTHLKNKKVDVICYESVADAIVNSPLCRARAAELFSCLAMACAGTASAHFVEDPEGVWVFQP
ncbi:AAA family ATPase [Pseudomonas atacamensis]|uniref:ATP-dependent nuclease n=1 Tax=Pseudomonas atacamensis TaxID=2565368 RepID=UPI001C3E0E59|nr:AAA family ATPase [Pseudomonas atacamensis]QXH74829.1 AAA family ATPase [Pseudomonas atacamensis]